MTDALPPPPERLAGVRIGAQLRSSGPLAVHAGEDRLGLEVEVHLVARDQLTDGFGVADLMARVRGASGVQHEALLPFTTGGKEEGFVFAVAKTVDAADLSELLGRGGAIDERRVLRI